MSLFEIASYSARKYCWQHILTPMALMMVLAAWSCGGRSNGSWNDLEPPTQKQVFPMRHTIQVGAFTDMNNAVRFTAKLKKQGVNAYHFRHDSGLYKVRFGNYASKEMARNRAERLKSVGIIEEYYLIGPEGFVAPSRRSDDIEQFRNEIVRTAVPALVCRVVP